MANLEQLKRLLQGAAEWNRWRDNDVEVSIDLSYADLREADLSYANLREVDLIGADLSGADLRGADLIGAYLSGAYLSYTTLSGAYLRGAKLGEATLSGADLNYAILSGAYLRRAYLNGADLIGATLREADLRDTTLSDATLSGADLRGATLSGVDLREADLSYADLRGADLCGADLGRTQMLRTNLENAVLTGACLEDWNINSTTKFNEAVCKYFYLKANQQERRPREGTFKPGEFAALFQQAVDTVDLIFKDGIDWQAFFQSFQELRSQYVDQDLSIQAIEKKRGGAFVVRVEVPPEIDKTVVETRAKELYASSYWALEAQYEERLRLQRQHLEDARQTIEVERQAVEAERRDKATLIGVVQTLASSQQGPKYDMRGAQFGGGFIETNYGTQYGSNTNHYGPNTKEITRLLFTLRDQAQTFPTDQKDEALDTLDDLEGDLAKPEPDHPRIGRRLKKLVALGSAISRPTTTSSEVNDFTTSGDLTAFMSNVIELTEKLGIPIEQIRLQSSSNP